MAGDEFLPKIETIFVSQSNPTSHELYSHLTSQTLRNILSGRMTFSPSDSPEVVQDQVAQFQALLPLVTVKWSKNGLGDISFFSLSKFRLNSFKFFFDMLSTWLLPGNRLNLVLVYAVDFLMPDMGDDIYTLCEIMIRVEKIKELELIQKNFPIIESELKLGLPSLRYARRVLEIRGLTSDEKTALIQELIAHLIERLPAEFDQDILTEMQHLLVTCSEKFKEVRESRHLTRIISVQYLFRKALREAVKKAPHKRHLCLKLFRAQLKTEFGSRTVLGVIIGVNFFRDKEVFEKAHILKAIQNYIPEAQVIDDSFFINRRGSEQVCALYLEIEKSNGKEFSPEEIRLLRHELPNDLKDRIEHLMHPVFMPRNEEETMRNILSLSEQIKYLRDIPQVFISFEEQTPGHLIFSVILVRVLRPELFSIQEMFKQSDTYLEYIHDRCQNAGTLRRKYKKEATVFRVKLPKDKFLRSDNSINLNKARQAVISELYRIIGEVRDYNGGMISKQDEVLCEFRDLINNKVKYNDLLLENFFYSLIPVIMRNVLEPEALCTLFLMLLESIESGPLKGKNHDIKIVRQHQFVYVMIKIEDRSLREEISRSINKLQLHSSQLANSYVSLDEMIFLGYIYRTDDNLRQDLFCQTIQHALESREAKILPLPVPLPLS